MNRLFVALAFLSFLSCSSGRQEEDLVKIDLTRNFPEKKINLNEIASVSYLRFDPGEHDEYLFRGSPAYVSERVVIVCDYRAGTFYFFTPEGTPLSKFNRKGQGPGEYSHIHGGITYDEKQDELFLAHRNHINVYSSAGDYKRTLQLPTDASLGRIFNFDDTYLLIQDDGEYYRRTEAKRKELTGQDFSVASEAGDGYTARFLLLSKADGTFIEYLPIPEDYTVMLGEVIEMGEYRNFLPVMSQRIVPYKEGFLLCNQETDTIFYYDRNRSLTSLWVKSPSVTSTNPPLCMNVFVESNDWQFFEKIIVKLNPDMPPPYLMIPLMRDKKSGEIFTQKISWDEYAGKQINITSKLIPQSPDGRTGILEMPLFELKEAYDEGKLSGELKNLVASMDEEENGVYALIRFK